MRLTVRRFFFMEIRLTVRHIYKGDGHVAARRYMTLPKKEKTDSKTDIQIIGIERRENTIVMRIDGCKVTAICRESNNAEIYSRVKGILIDSVISNSAAKI